MQIFKKEEPLVSITGLSKKYGDQLILRDIGTADRPFVIYNVTRPNLLQGQTVAIVGASGSGKSTLFKMITGVHSATTGTISIPDPDDKGSYKTLSAGDVGFVQQTYPLSRNQTVLQMLTDAAVQGKIPKAERKNLLNFYLESWSLKDQMYLSTCQLSGGQRQRVAIIEQLLCSHHFMIFDEPFSGLDVRNIDDVVKSFKKITTSSEISTIIFSTHDIELAVELSDTIFILGYERGPDNKRIPGGTVLKEYDLMEMGLAWEGFSPLHQELVQEVKALIKSS